MARALQGAGTASVPEHRPMHIPSTRTVSRHLLVLARTPLWAVQLLTQAKSFRANPLLGSRRLNRAGLHVARLLLAHAVMRARMAMLARGVSAEHRAAWYRDGFVVVPDAIGAADVARLRAEILAADVEVRECVQGDTLTHRMPLDPDTRPALPLAAATLDTPWIAKLLRFAAGKAVRPLAYVQTIRNNEVEGGPDPQKLLHSDTFHPTMKSWLFLDDVDGVNGPFTYVPGSHRASRARLRWEYRKSLEIAGGDDRYSGNGSLRLSEADRLEMGLPAPVGLAVAAGTLVVANTHGFHCRGRASGRAARTELWTLSRSNPFNPSPGLDLAFVDALQHRALALWRRFEDRRAEARGTRSSWHVVDLPNVLAGLAPSVSAAGSEPKAPIAPPARRPVVGGAESADVARFPGRASGPASPRPGADGHDRVELDRAA